MHSRRVVPFFVKGALNGLLFVSSSGVVRLWGVGGSRTNDSIVPVVAGEACVSLVKVEVHTHTHTHTQAHTRTHARTRTNKHVHTRTHTHTRTCAPAPPA